MHYHLENILIAIYRVAQLERNGWLIFKRNIQVQQQKKHGAIGFVTPMHKWAEGMFRKAARQPIALGSADIKL